MQVPIGSIPGELIKEVRNRKWTFFLLFAAISSLLLVIGFVWPEKYSSTVTIFVDDQNIIRPLMEGSAVTTKITDRSSEAKQLLFSHRVLSKLASNKDIWGDTDSNKINERVAILKKTIRFGKLSDNYFNINYKGTDPVRTFKVAQKLGQLFIAESDDKKKEESRSAYSFVDKQVKTYQVQLKQSVDTLKDFLSSNVEGTEDSVTRRISELQSQIEQADLELKELLTQKSSLTAQMKDAGKLLAQTRVGNPYTARINTLQEQLDVLRLSYHDSYPDIVSLKQQINDLHKALEEELKSEKKPAARSNAEYNPLYLELESELAKTKKKIRTVNTRISSLKELLVAANGRMERFQSNKAKLAELTRDSEVNRGIYEDLLKRREKARVSMHLDIEGQGLSYKIHEPAEYPLNPVGLQFTHFAMLGLLMGLILPLGIFAGIYQIDPRVRIGSVLEENTGIPVLTTIPYLSTPLEARKNRYKTILIFGFGIILIIAYISITWLKIKGEI